MEKVKFFLIADGIFLLIGAIFFLSLYLRRHKGMGGFRDDIWKKKEEVRKAQAQAFEDHVDKKILLEFKDETASAGAAPSAPKPEPPINASQQKAEPARFRVPNFRGKPHEILGVDPGADKELILTAYKYWIKRYHPDRVHHLGAKYIEQARRRAEQLNMARDTLLATFKK